VLIDISESNDGESFSFHLNLSAVLAKEGGTWRIVSIHYSNVVGEQGSEN